MDYSDLVNLWEEQRKKYTKWEVDLTFGALNLCNKFEEFLDLKDKEWTEFNGEKKHKYVSLVDFYNKDKAVRVDNIKIDSANERGELIFGVSVSFARGESSIPRDNYYVAVAMRFNDEKIEYSLFDREKNCAEELWVTNSDDLCKKIANVFEVGLRNNPLVGFSIKKSRIGFLSD